MPFGDPAADPDAFLTSMEAYAALGIDMACVMPMTPDPVAFVTTVGEQVIPRLNQIG